MMAANSNNTQTIAAHGTILSILLRLLSFILSQLTIRLISVSTLGQASIPLELLLSSALFIGREGFRLALTKEVAYTNDDDKKEKGSIERRDSEQQQLINVSWLSIPVGALLSLFALLIHLNNCKVNNSINNSSDNNEDIISLLDYQLAGILYCTSSLIESLAEPLVIQCLQLMDVTTKAKAEGVALVMKSISCFTCLYLMRCKWFGDVIRMAMIHSLEGDYNMSDDTNFAVTAFGLSQLVYALVFTSIMYRHALTKKNGSIQWPKYTNKASISNFHMYTLYLVCIFTLQGLFKHALTEGDKIVLSALAGSYDQGVYALASSYGGLAARLLLQPMEENARLLFSRQGALISQHVTATDNYQDKEKNKLASFNLLKELEDTYYFLMKIVLYIGLLFGTVATNYTSILLRLLAGSRWGTNVGTCDALSAFCVYTAFLALNGITEAFVYGVARSGKDVGKIGIAHAIVGGIFALLAPTLVRKYGAVGLIAANCISMALRAAYSIRYATTYFAKAGRRSSFISVSSRMLPNILVVTAFGVSFVVSRLSKIHVYDAQVTAGISWMIAGAAHITTGIICVVIVSSIMWVAEKDIKSSVLNVIKRKIE